MSGLSIVKVVDVRSGPFSGFAYRLAVGMREAADDEGHIGDVPLVLFFLCQLCIVAVVRSHIYRPTVSFAEQYLLS